MSLSNKNVILVDDEPGVLFALKLLLETLKLNVKDFSNPESALAYIEANTESIDYVLSDLRMPQMNGIELLMKVRQFSPDLKFFIMSGHAEEEEQRQAKMAGSNGFLSKPFSPDQVCQLFSSS